MKRINLEAIYQIVSELKAKVLNNFITNVVVVNSHDILLSFSFFKEKLLISLNHQCPFMSLVDKEFSSHTVLGQYNDNLRKYIKGSYISNIEVVNDDRVVKFSLYKSDEFYQKETGYLIVELIPTISNLIYLNAKNEIVFAKHYSDLTASRPIIKKLEYVPLVKNKELERGTFDYTSFKKDVDDYLLDSLHLKQKEKALPLFNFFKQKEKSLKKKVKVLESEKLEAEAKLEYKDIGEYLLTYKNEVEELNSYINNIKDLYNRDLSVEENASNIFNKYKKAKRTIENDIREIDIAYKEIKEYEHLLSIFDYLSDEEIEILSYKYLHHKKKVKINYESTDPYYIKYKNVRIGFGKNKEQNNNLTFKKANKEDTFIHYAHSSASHVIIFSNNVDKDTLLVGLEIALILAGQEDGDIQVAKVKDIKKGPSMGQVLLNKYETYTLKSVRNETKALLKEQKRF